MERPVGQSQDNQRVFLSDYAIRTKNDICEQYYPSTSVETLPILNFLKTGDLGGVPYRIYARPAYWLSIRKKQAPEIIELCVQYPGHFFNKGLSRVFLNELPDAVRRTFWKSAKQKNRETSNEYKKSKREYYKKIGSK